MMGFSICTRGVFQMNELLLCERYEMMARCATRPPREAKFKRLRDARLRLPAPPPVG